MNAILTASFGAARAVRFFLALIGILALTGLTGAGAAPGGTGEALALRSALRIAQAAVPSVAAASSEPRFLGQQRTPAGRTLIDPRMMRSGAIRRRSATGSSTVPIPGAVQTFDLFNPPPAFRPLVGYGNPAAPDNNPADPPIYLNSLSPLNLTPVWSQDETFIVFSSNRTLQGGIQPDGRFHLWAISVNGGEAYQITTSTGASGGGEFFPALVSSDNRIGFTSDAQSPGVQNLYAIPFSYSVLTANNNAAGSEVNVSDNTVVTSYTIRTDAFAMSNGGTGFDQVQRPTFSPINNDLVIFSAHSTDGIYTGHYHIYYLYLGTGGYDPNNTSLPAKLTDGPAEDTDPAYSKDGQFIAFASTATQVITNPSNAFSSNPDTSQSLTQNVDPGNLRNLFLIGGGGGIGVGSAGFGVVPTQLQGTPYYGRVTTSGFDNFGPAWSSVTFNQYTNAPPGFEYLAFARGSSPAAPHDIYYLQTVRNINSGGETGKSDEVSTTPQPPNAPVYQIDAGGPEITDSTGNDYTSDSYLQFNLGQFVNLAYGGTTGFTNATFNTTNDPGTPPEIYNYYRTKGDFTYVLPSLTPGAPYNVRLHFADPFSTASGQRRFNVYINGALVLNNYDIVAQAKASNGVLGGLVTDSATSAAVTGATVTVTDYTTGAVIPPSPLTTAAVSSPLPPNGDGNPLNYDTPIQSGTFRVTVSAPGYDTVSQVVNVNSANFSRADFALALSTTDGQVTGTVKDTGGNPVFAASVLVTSTANANPTHNGGNDPPEFYGTNPTTGGSGTFSQNLPAGTYNVTVNAPGYAVQTQQVTITAGTTTPVAFTLAVPPAVGTLGGLVTDTTSKITLPGALVTVSSGGVPVAIFQTSAATSSPAAPNGDGNPINYSGLLPAGGYSVFVQSYGYSPSQEPKTVTAGAFVRKDAALTSTNGTPAGQNTAVVVTLPATATTTQQIVNTSAGAVTLKAGGIYIEFQPVVGDPIVQGIEVRAVADPTMSSGFGSFAASSDTSRPTNITALGGNNQVTLTFEPPATGFPPDLFNIYRSIPTTASVTTVNQPGAGSGTEGTTPYTSVPYNPASAFTTYTDTGVTNGTEYYYQVTAVYKERITPEGYLLTTGAGTVANAVIKLNTDDNGPPNPVPANSYDDVYPTWSPFHSIFSISYESGSVQNANPNSGGFLNGVLNGTVFGGRTVTYNDPTTGFPSETAFSVGAGGSVVSTTAAAGYTVQPTYIGILQSQVLNLDPPTLLRFSASEIVHVQAAGTNPVTGTPTKTGLNPGQQVTFTVRLSDREAGIDDGNSGLPTGGADATKPQVFIQIKDPDSKYQDAQGFEHKVFARDSNYITQANHASNDITSNAVNGQAPGIEAISIDDEGIAVTAPRDDLYPGYALNGGYVFPRGAHGGFYSQKGVESIFIGKNGGGTNPYVTTAGKGSAGFVPGTDPNQFLAWGPEYECQFLNPQFATGGGTNAPADGSISDYATPYYLAGVDDFQAFSGAGKQRPTANVGGRPAEWLQLSRVPDAQQDHLGGILYTVTWKTPASGSDFYLDVIAFDKAKFPTFPPLTSQFSGGQVNWRIYDNIGGFSTNLSIGNNDILVVSDNALGQKFAATTFGGTNGNLNLVPKLYGSEADFTDVDVNMLPDSVYAGYPRDSTVTPPNTVFLPYIVPFGIPFSPFSQPGQLLVPRYLNGLGVGSYDDTIIDDGGTKDGVPYVQSQRYSLWRILARGPVPASVLSAYLPTKQPQPAVLDTQSPNPAYRNIAAATVLDAHRCVIWTSPYTGDLVTDPGALDDPGSFSQPGAPDRPSTQTILRNFVQAGGRLFLSGQDVGSTLTLGGTVANGPGGFLSDVMNAKLASTGGGTYQLGAAANQITSLPTYDGSSGGSNGSFSYPVIVGTFGSGFGVSDLAGQPYQSRLEISGAPFFDVNLQSDSSLSQRTGPLVPSGANLLGQPDTLTPTNGATTAITYAGGAVAMVFHDDPYKTAGSGTLPNGGTGGRTVYAGFGLEGLSNDAYASDVPNGGVLTEVPPVGPRNPRTNILHNVVCYLRTGSVSGLITQTAGTGAGSGQGVGGVTVYLVPTSSTAPPTRATFSATTALDGHFSIVGVEPGTYTLAAYKAGYARAVTNAGVDFTVEGDVNDTATLTITPQPPGNIEGNVHDTAGKPVIGATVSFLSKDKTILKTATTFDGSVPTQPAGNYFLPSVPVTDYSGTATGPNNPNGNPEYLAAAAPDPPYATDVNVLANTTTGDGSALGGPPVTFTLTPILATISGRIYDNTVGDNAAGGANVSGATVALTDSKGNPVLNAAGVPITAAAAADGTYTLVGIPATQTATLYIVTASKAGYSPGSLPAQPVYLGDILTGQDIGLTPTPPGSITGTVKDAAGNPVPSATVTFKSADGTVTKTATTDAGGNFTISGVPPATYSGTAVGPLNPNGRPVSSSSAPQTVTVTGGATAGPVNFVVNTIPPSFSGKITDTSGNPLVNALVSVTNSATGALVGTTHSAADGTYTTTSFSIPPGGTYTVTASLAGYLSGTLTDSAGNTKFTVYNGDALTGQNIVLTSQQPGTVQGTVLDTSGNPIGGATVTITSADGTQTYTATTAADGTYSIAKVKFDTYTGTAVGPKNASGNLEYTSATASAFVVNPSPPATTVNFTLTPISPTVTGTVTDATTGAVLGAVKVTFTPTAGGTPVVVTTNASGVYLSGPLSPGTYTVTASASAGYFDLTKTVTLNLGDTVTLDFALGQKGTLIGYVTDASTGQPLAGVTLTVKDAATGVGVTTTPTPLTTVAVVTTGPDGSPINYLGNLSPGTYTVTATKGGYDTQTSASVTITKGPFGRVDFKLLSSVGTLGGLVTASGGTTPVAGATVTVADATGTVIATFTTSGSTSTPAPPNGDGSPLNYSGQLLKGTYTVTVSKGTTKTAAKTITILGGQFNRLDFTGSAGLPPLHTFPGGAIQFLSTPYDYSSSTFDTLFGALNTAPAGTTPNGNRSHVAVWDPTAGGGAGAYALDPNPPADSLRLGVGYWVFLKNPVNITTQGPSPTTATVPVALHAYWNQIGVPTPNGVPVSSLLFDNGTGGTISFATAASSAYHIVSPTLYRYDGTSYQPVGAGDTLQPWQGYWIKVFAAATLEIPTK